MLFKFHIKNHLDIFHQILFLYETTGFQFEKNVIFEILNEFIKGSETFSLIFINKLTKKIENGELEEQNLEKMLNLVRVAKIDSLNVEIYFKLSEKLLPFCLDYKKKKLLSFFIGRISLMTGMNLNASIDFIEKTAGERGALKQLLEKLKTMKGLLNGESKKEIEVAWGGQEEWLENFDFGRKGECYAFVEFVHKSVIFIFFN